jgi:RimJ/RimL family protein N-acetyltransferase
VVPTIETPRLRLRAIEETDLERWSAVMADERTVRYVGGSVLGREEVWRRLLSSRGLWAMYGYGYWAAERKEDGVMVAQVGFADFKREMTPSIEGLPEAGWIVAPDAWGQGVASEALGACLDWADRTLGPREIVAIIDHENAASIRVADKLGFTAREEAIYKGEPILLFRRYAAAVR